MIAPVYYCVVLLTLLLLTAAYYIVLQLFYQSANGDETWWYAELGFDAQLSLSGVVSCGLGHPLINVEMPFAERVSLRLYLRANMGSPEVRTKYDSQV